MSSLLPTFVRCSLLLFLLLTACLPSAGQTAQSEYCREPADAAYTLRQNDTLSRNITRNQRHIFELSLQPRQYVHAIVEQKGIDVIVRLLDPNRFLLIERNSPNAKVGPEAVSTVADTAGTYYLEVCADRSQPANGSYQLKIEGPRESMTADEKRVAAEHLLMEANNFARKQARLEAIKSLEQALEIWRGLGDVREEGYVLCNIGENYKYLRNFAEAKENLDKAFLQLGKVQDSAGQATVLNWMGAAYRDLDDKLKALDNYRQALELWIRVGDLWGQALIHNNTGFLYSEIGEQRNSIASLELALPLWREVDDRGMELNTLNNIGKANLDLGNLTTAYQTFQRIILSCGEVPQPCRLEPYARNSLGIIHDTWGAATEALSEYQQALKQFREAGNSTDEAKVLDNTGMVFAGLGDPSTALDHFNEALKIRERANHFGEEITRSNMGYALMLSGKYPEALKQLEQAYNLSMASHDQRFQAYTLMRMGAVQLAMDQIEKALESYKQALEIQNRIDDRRGQAITLDKLGEVYSLLDQSLQAVKHYQQALDRWIALDDQQGEALSLYGIARVQRRQNRLENARDTIVKAIEKVESFRNRMTSHQLRLSYFAARRDFYELEIDVRMRLYNRTGSETELELALFASERGRARNLLDLLNESRTDIRQGVDSRLLDLERAQIAQLREKRWQLQTLAGRKHSKEEQNALERELQTLRRSFDETQGEIRKRSPQYAALTQPQPLKLSEIQQLLDDNTILLEYALGEEQSYLWVVTPDKIQPFILPGRTRIEAAAESFRKSLTAWESRRSWEDPLKYTQKLRTAPANYQQRALELSEIVLGRATSMLGNKRLVIVADGELQYVSFAALRIASKTRRAKSTPTTLIANNEIVYQPSASALALIRATSRPAPTKTLAVFADPVFNDRDERVRRDSSQAKNDPTLPALSRETIRALRDAGDIGSVDGVLRLERLPYSRGEADAIVATAAPGSLMKRFDFEASRAHVLNQELKQFRMVHIATHGILNGQNPEYSGLVFSLVDERGRPQDGFLRLADIYNMNLPIQMVVLSACQTGVGKPVKGEGLIALTRGFMYAGAARVVASLWKVDDEATAELMKSFYTYLLEKKMPAAAALRQAQLDLMQDRPEPYYWAGFVLQGEWR
jgi:CHAT domain-containing protein/predicted negative regulator of RcsB-dependent stress response